MLQLLCRRTEARMLTLLDAHDKPSFWTRERSRIHVEHGWIEN
jgi:hypothetical protein